MGLRLVELKPRFVTNSADRHGMGVSLLCPICRSERIVVWFKNPIDGGAPSDSHAHLWVRRGESFDGMTLSPSIDASCIGQIPCSRSDADNLGRSHWHGQIENGEVR